MKRRYQIIAVVAILGISFPRIACSQKVDLHDCEKPGGDKKITTFTVDLPIPAQRAQSRVLKVFTMLGLSPSAVGSTPRIRSSGIAARKRTPGPATIAVAKSLQRSWRVTWRTPPPS